MTMLESLSQTVVSGIVQIIVAIVGAIGVVYAAMITTKFVKQKKVIQEKENELASVFKIVKRPSREYSWLYDKYEYLDTAFDGYCVINTANNEEFISDKICHIIGRKRTDLGKHVADLLRFVDHGDFAKFETMVGRLIKGLDQKSTGIKKLKTASGQWAEFEVTAVLDGPFILTIWKFQKYQPISVAV